MTRPAADTLDLPPLDAAEPTPVVFIIGAGPVGTLLAARLARAGVPVAGVHGRASELSRLASAVSGVLGSSGDLPAIVAESDVVIVSVRDARIPEIAGQLAAEKRLRRDQVVLHTSGNRPAGEMLAAARPHVKGIGTLHPLVAVTDAPGTLENLENATFGVEGDPPALAAARKLVRLMHGRPLALRAEAMPLYHAGAVVASNYLVALADVARSLLVAAGVPEDQALPALVPLMKSAVHNVAEVGLPAAMTGPVARGELFSVERQIAALESGAPAVLDLYRRLGREVLRVADGLDDETERRLSALFGGGGEGAVRAATKDRPAAKKRR